MQLVAFKFSFVCYYQLLNLSNITHSFQVYASSDVTQGLDQKARFLTAKMSKKVYKTCQIIIIHSLCQKYPKAVPFFIFIFFSGIPVTAMAISYIRCLVYPAAVSYFGAQFSVFFFFD